MITELAQFTDTFAPIIGGIGLKPKEGLHILLKVIQQEDGTFAISSEQASEFYGKKTKEIGPLIKKCAGLAQVAWMIDTNKCLDAPARAIHSASPFCLAFKRSALVGGEKYNEIAKEIEKGNAKKKQIYDRLEDYFQQTLAFLEEDEVELNALAIAFQQKLNSWEKLNALLLSHAEFAQVKDPEYIGIYLDLSVEQYQIPHNRYLKKRLFNTGDYNLDDETGLTWGTSDFLNGYGSKKPFLLHKTAAFNIPGRISSAHARSLFEFTGLLGRRILPNPLPIFILNEELQTSAFIIFKREAEQEPENRKKHSEIIRELYESHQDDLGNYYLLYHMMGEVIDFDYVSKFDYHLNDANGQPWKIEKIMELGEEQLLDSVFDLQNQLLPTILNNSLVVRTKSGGIITKFFEELEQQYCDNNNGIIYNLVQKYRKAWYDFIYKSKRSSITGAAFYEMMKYSIISDIKRDKEGDKFWIICQKLNIWFSLNQYFDPHHTNFNHNDMSKTIPRLLDKMRAVANDGAHFESPEEFAFGAGQVIYFLLDKSQSNKKTHSLLEPFTQKSDLGQLKIEISRTFDRYKHEVDFSKGRFTNLMTEVLGYDDEIDLKKQFPMFLAGYFAKAIIFEKKQEVQTL
jgi:CRISPR-associated protein Csh1